MLRSCVDAFKSVLKTILGNIFMKNLFLSFHFLIANSFPHWISTFVSGKSHSLVWTRVIVWRSERHTPNPNFREVTPPPQVAINTCHKDDSCEIYVLNSPRAYIGKLQSNGAPFCFDVMTISSLCFLLIFGLHFLLCYTKPVGKWHIASVEEKGKYYENYDCV